MTYDYVRIKKKDTAQLFSYPFGWALVKPEIRISEKVTCALVGGANYTLTTFLISFLNLPDLTESNNCQFVMQYVFLRFFSCFPCFKILFSTKL